MNSIYCNICGSDTFHDANGRILAQCSRCGSLERTRLLWLYLQRHIKEGRLKKNSKVLHIAPETGIFHQLSQLLDADNYRVSDYNPKNYPHIPSCTNINLMDLICEKSNSYDFIIHSHVLEHIDCNLAYPLFHLHRMLKYNGRHIFIVPFINGAYEESFTELPDEIRTQRFGQFDHIRNFGNADINKHLGRLLALPANFDASLDFSTDTLRTCNIPQSHWVGFHAGTVFDLGKNDYLLNKKNTKKQQRAHGIID